MTQTRSFPLLFDIKHPAAGLSRKRPATGIASILLGLLYCCSSAWAQQLPTAPQRRPPQTDIRHIALDLQFDWPKKQAYGKAGITLAMLQPTDSVALDAGMLGIQDIALAAGTPLKYRYDGSDRDDALVIALDRRYAPGETITLHIRYHTNHVNRIDPNNLWGSFGKGLRFSMPTSNDPLKPREIWSSGEPTGNRYWFPGRDAPDDWHTTELRITAEKPLTATGSGHLRETTDNGNNTRTFTWLQEKPQPNHLTGFVVGEYSDTPQRCGERLAHNFGYPEETEGVAASVVRLPDMMRFFEEITGIPFPYPAYHQVFVQDLPAGIECPGFSAITENMVDDERTHADYLYLWDGQEAQSLAAQWFGNYLTPADWQHAWLSESFCRYFDCLYSEFRNGRDEMQLWSRLFDQNTCLYDWNAGIRRLLVTQHYDAPETMLRDNYASARGALTLHMLRKQLGENKWREAIRLYVQNGAGKPLTTNDFQQAVARANGEPLDWFFEQWVYQTGHPVFEVIQQYDAAQKQLTLTVRQTQKNAPDNPYPQTAFFRGKIDIGIDERTETVWIEAKAENVFTFRHPQQPRLVRFDAENAWIKELRFEKTPDEWLYHFEHDPDALGRRRAMEELVKIARADSTSGGARKNVLAAFRRTIAGPSYWRWRLQVLQQLQGLIVAQQGFAPDPETEALLLAVIERDKSWLRAGAIGFLGATRDARFADLYLRYLSDESDRVINAAAVALGKSKSPKAYEALAALVHKPSWKNQSLMSALVGLRELGDPRGFDVAFAALSDLQLRRWRLPDPPVWDLRVFAAETIAALGRSEAAFPLVFNRFQKSVQENDLEGIFYNTVLVSKLADPRGREVFSMLREKFSGDAGIMSAVERYEEQYLSMLK
jgi:aminopeptidase N